MEAGLDQNITANAKTDGYNEHNAKVQLPKKVHLGYLQPIADLIYRHDLIFQPQLFSHPLYM